ncbi:MAG: Uma2 family endonuclease [Chloroflexi bacterium]|jgi:Uma2 family endonuclease|nr:Uma2 family endonuclease [Chloroflexota bacterium]
MAVHIQHITVEEFDEFVTLPENAERLFEYIGGEVVEGVSNQQSSAIAYRLGLLVGMYLLQNNIGMVGTGADGGYRIAGERYMPDVAFVSKDRQPEPSDQAYSPIPPDLAIEVLSPSNTAHEMRIKVVNYLSVGTVVWVVDPDRKRVEVYTSGQPVRQIGIDGVLDGGAVLPGFGVAVKDIFEV